MAAPPSRGKRFLKLAGMTASVAGNLAKTKVKALFQSEEDAASSREEANRESGNRIAKTLGELKGAVMKVGQMASIAHDVLPKELAEALGQLQREAPPMDYEHIAEQIERELGAAPDVLFRRFEQQPFAAASIGQVHRATTDVYRRKDVENLLRIKHLLYDRKFTIAGARQELRKGAAKLEPAPVSGLYRARQSLARVREQLDLLAAAIRAEPEPAHLASDPAAFMRSVGGARGLLEAEAANPANQSIPSIIERPDRGRDG